MNLNQQQRRALRDSGLLLVPGGHAEVEIVVVNSRFIASSAPVTSAEQAKAFHNAVRTNHPTASHHVPAYIIGHGNSTLSFCSDDGEPAGSSGKPILSVLQGSGFGDIAVVVTRYFGGTKLGIGGLVRAYSDAAKTVLDRTSCFQKVIVSQAKVTVPYPHYETVRKFLVANGAVELQENFTDIVEISFGILTDAEDSICQSLADLTHGTGQFEILSSGNLSTVPVLL